MGSGDELKRWHLRKMARAAEYAYMRKRRRRGCAIDSAAPRVFLTVVASAEAKFNPQPRITK